MSTRGALPLVLLALGALAAAAPEPVKVRIEFIVEDARGQPVLYPEPSGKDPVDLSLELYRDGALVGRGPVALAPAEPGKGIPYLGSSRLQSRPVGAYEVKLTARQGTMSADETAVFDLVPVPRLEALPRP